MFFKQQLANGKYYINRVKSISGDIGKVVKIELENGQVHAINNKCTYIPHLTSYICLKCGNETAFLYDFESHADVIDFIKRVEEMYFKY